MNSPPSRFKTVKEVSSIHVFTELIGPRGEINSVKTLTTIHNMVLDQQELLLPAYVLFYLEVEFDVPSCSSQVLWSKIG